MTPRSIPCRMCKAGPGEPCKYKGAQIPPWTILGGHGSRTPRSHRCYHYRRVEDVLLIGELDANRRPRLSLERPR